MTMMLGIGQVTKTDGPVDEASNNTGEDDNYEKKLPAHEKKKASIAANIDDSKTPGAKSISQGDSSSCSLKSGVLGVRKQPKSENGASIPVIDNSLKKRAAPTGFHYMAGWSVPRQYKMLRIQPDDAVTSITSIHKSPMPSGNASSPTGFSGPNEWGNRENKLKEKVDNAFGATIDSHHKVRSFNRKRSDDMQGQGRISMLTDVSPRMEKIVPVPLTKPTQGTRCSFTKDKSKTSRAPPKKQRNCKAPVLTGHRMNDKPSNNIGEFDPDHKDLLVAASSIHTAREHACSNPFWKKMESLFAPVAAKDLQFLNRQLNPIKELNQTGPQMLSDVCEAVGVRTKSTTEVGNLNQESVKCADLGGPKAEKTMSLVPPLFQRVLSALIDEDEGKESYNSNEGATKIFQCINDYSHKDKEKCEVESKQADDGSSFLTSMNFPWTDQDDQNMLNSSLVPLMSSGNHQYQGLSLDDKLALELQSIGLNCEVMPLVDGGEEWIDKEIKGLERELYQQVLARVLSLEAKVKNSLSKLKASIQSDPKLDKRSIEESAMDQLVQITYSSTVIRPKKSSRKRKFSVKKPASLDFVNRTLARCKQFENSGRSCFSEPYLQDRILNKPTSEISVGPHDCNGLMMSKEAQKNITNQDSGFMINKERQELPSKIGSSPSSEENEVLSIGHPGQVETGFSGLKQSLSNPSGLAATYDFTLTKGKTESPRDIASCASSNPNLTSKHCGIHSEKVVKDGDKNEDEVTVNSTSSGVNISEPKSKQKRTLSRIGMQELAKSEQLSSIKACDPKTNANSVPHSPPGAASQPLSEGTLLDDAELAKFLDSNFLDLERLLDFDDEGLLDDNDCAGLDVPMDNLSDIDFSFKGGLL